MVNKCVAPRCFVDHSERKRKKKDEPCNTVTVTTTRNAPAQPPKVSTFHFPSETKNKYLFDRWRNAVPRSDWYPTENSVLCEHHFLPRDFKEERSDKNYSRRKGKDVNLKRS